MSQATTAISGLGRAPVGSSGAKPRWWSFDVLRYVAALAVIYWHSPETDEDFVGRGLVTWAVPCFAAQVVYWLCRELRARPQSTFPPYWRKRLLKIGVPFAAWSLIYLLVREAEHAFIKHDGLFPLEWQMLWIGTAHHLWFLPFVILVSLVLFFPIRWSVACPVRRAVLATVAAGLGVFVALYPQPFTVQEYLLLQTWSALPATLWAIALAYLPLEKPTHRLTAWRWGVIVPLLALLGYQLAAGGASLTNNLIGWLFVALACLPWQHFWIARLQPLGRLAYGVYLVHILFLIGLRVAGHRLFHLAPGVGFNLTIFAMAAVLSTLAAWVLSRYRLTRWLVPA